MQRPVDYVKDGAIVTVTLNEPETRNAISDITVVDAIVEAIERIGRDRSVAVGILTGSGSTFSSGGNLKMMGVNEGIVEMLGTNTRLNYRDGIQRIPIAFERLEVPMIAAVNGPAIGAGCDLACMCDIRIAGSGARFAESFVKLGIIPGDGGAWLLSRAVGFSKACEMAFTGDAIDAAQALSCGLVSQVVPDGELMTAARNLARRIAVNPTHALRMTKRLLREGQYMRLDSLLEIAAAMQALAHAEPSYQETIMAIRERANAKK